MKYFSALAYRQQGVGRFIWNVDKTTLTVDGSPILLTDFFGGLKECLESVQKNISIGLRGCPTDDILERIDQALVPDSSGQPFWFIEEPHNQQLFQSFIEFPQNGLKQYRPRLLEHLVKDPQLFTYVDEKLTAKVGK
jgi:hypothetical protein